MPGSNPRDSDFLALGCSLALGCFCVAKIDSHCALTPENGPTSLLLMLHVPENLPERLATSFLEPPLRSSDSLGQGWARDSAFLIRAQVMLAWPVQGPGFEDH